ncbi:hypothetical protein MRX96_036176 [Rhipicephalus microplus]
MSYARKNAAAAVIQRWVRYKFKPWLQRAESHASAEELPSSSRHWIDEDHGATVNTTLEDSVLRPEELEPSDDDRISSEHALP